MLLCCAGVQDGAAAAAAAQLCDPTMPGSPHYLGERPVNQSDISGNACVQQVVHLHTNQHVEPPCHDAGSVSY